MSTEPYLLIKRTWRKLPKHLRRLARLAGLVNIAERFIKKRIVPRASHDAIYDEYFFAVTKTISEVSADAIARSIVEFLKPESLLDVGCGTGVFLEKLRFCGIKVAGLDCSETALRMCRERGLKVFKCDLERDPPPEFGQVDLVMSLEVAEHLPPSCADRYVAALTGYSKRILLTAAAPGQGGIDHVNEQPRQYWIDKFAFRGCSYDECLTVKMRDIWENKGVAWTYRANLMIFGRT